MVMKYLVHGARCHSAELLGTFTLIKFLIHSFLHLTSASSRYCRRSGKKPADVTIARVAQHASMVSIVKYEEQLILYTVNYPAIRSQVCGTRDRDWREGSKRGNHCLEVHCIV